jgi:antibiotic biosynthesis monooxygenase (ABM) superfamily enzyme
MTTETAPHPSVPAPPAPPSVHARAIATWVTIFPLVAIGMTLMAGISATWHPVLRALVLTLVVVPLAVYVIVPRVLGLYLRLRRRGTRA